MQIWHSSKKFSKMGACFIFALAATSALASYSPAEWLNFKAPVAGKPNPIGNYTNGCLIGGEKVPFNGVGYQVVRQEKNRYYAHPEMLQYLQNLGKKLHAAHLPAMLISDVAMPAGGRFVDGHHSHQMGLDVDIWFRMGKLTAKEAYHSTGLANLMANPTTKKMTSDWTNQQETLLKLAASDPHVARIFVNPLIKVHLCQTVKGDRQWLHKIRPWYGHNSHFHVRLSCPKGAQYCHNQAAIPVGDGCDQSLYAWLKPKPKPTKPGKPKPVVIPPPPPLCQLLLDEQAKKIEQLKKNP
ncbi:penicillin-insensitive murein endopeptidase [Actinobacillus delphinicola]|uniref:Penicillin-insensitive murein endopeptidase n=2 Tax=Actinobacillus delphinicola TaxID=51161 RepID=A0A448TRR7_9PAST|nr:penicillin-insensitive murein endopeptidase [Actinobacillus delphinicola]VEJ08689.1 penicillin-insensitive murein endopeptidase [Actinobacillus delphinicola]